MTAVKNINRQDLKKAFRALTDKEVNRIEINLNNGIKVETGDFFVTEFNSALGVDVLKGCCPATLANTVNPVKAAKKYGRYSFSVPTKWYNTFNRLDDACNGNFQLCLDLVGNQGVQRLLRDEIRRRAKQKVN